MRPTLLPLLVLLACAGPPEVSEPAPPAVVDPAAPLPGDSVYQLEVPLVDQDGEETTLAVHRGHPTVISMFYASCPQACPLLIEDVRGLEARLSPEDMADLRVLLVSLDPDRDTPEVMREVVERHDLDTARWTLTRTEATHVREVAAVLGIRYRMRADGEMNHSSILTVLDREGRVLITEEGLGLDRGKLVAAIEAQRTGS